MSDVRGVESLLVRRYLGDVLVRRRLHVATDVFARDVLDHGPEGVVRGIEALILRVRRFLSAFPDLTIAIHALAVEPPVAMAWFTWQGTQVEWFMGLPGSGRKVRVGCVGIFRAEAGRLTERWEFVDPQVVPPVAPSPRVSDRRPRLAPCDRPLLRIRW